MFCACCCLLSKGNSKPLFCFNKENTKKFTALQYIGAIGPVYLNTHYGPIGSS